MQDQLQTERNLEQRMATRENIRFLWLNRSMFKDIKLSLSNISINLPQLSSFSRVRFSVNNLFGESFRSPLTQFSNLANVFKFGGSSTMPVVKQVSLKTEAIDILQINPNGPANINLTQVVAQSSYSLKKTLEGAQQQVKEAAEAKAREQLGDNGRSRR